MARDIENVNITLPGESDTIELIVNGEPTEVVIALDSWASAVHADDADTVSGHTVSRDVLADEYTNAEIDSMISSAGVVQTVNNVSPDANGNVALTKGDIGLGNVDNTSDASKPISTATQAALDLKVDKVDGKGLSSNDYTDADKTKLGDLPTGADITAALAGKVDKETGKGLSTNDFTDAEKTKLQGIETGAEVNVQANWNEADSTADSFIQNKPTIPTKVSDLQNDSGFITGINWGDVGGTLSDQTDLINALDSKADNSTVGSIATAVSNHIGNTTVHVTANDKTTWNGKQDALTFDSTPTASSSNPVTSDGIKTALDTKASASDLAAHTGDTVIHVTATDKTNWNGKITEPPGGTAGQVLKKTASGTEWGDAAGSASDITYDNTTSGLTATNVQDAIDESHSELITGLSSAVKSVNTETPAASGNVEVSASDIPANGMGTKETSGNPIEIEDGVAGNALDLSVELEPIQSGSGDPSPTNIRPITGRTEVNVLRTGKNLFDGILIQHGIDYASGEDNSNSNLRCSDFIEVSPTTQYYFLFPSENVVVHWYDKNKNHIRPKDGGGVITSPSNAKYVRFNSSLSSERELWNNANISVNYPATFTEYEPYAGQSISIQLGQTVYGGTLNVTTGELVVDRVKTAITALNRNNATSYYAIVSPVPKANLFASEHIISDKMPVANTSESVGIFTNANGAIRVNTENEYDTAADAIASFGGSFDVCYELATPQTIQLTAQQLALLEGYNILTTDGDTLNLRYIGSEASNVQAEIDEFEESTRKLAGSLAMVETSPATANHAVGDLIVYNNQLYKVIVAIASGEAIVVGTNVVADSVADEIEAINTYSTSETVVGKWIDGKPIYRRSVTVTSGFSTGMTLIDGVSSIDSVVNISGTLVRSDSNILNIPYVYGNTVYSNIFCNPNTGVVGLEYSGIIPIKVIVVIEYTKTTD